MRKKETGIKLKTVIEITAPFKGNTNNDFIKNLEVGDKVTLEMAIGNSRGASGAVFTLNNFY